MRCDSDSLCFTVLQPEQVFELGYHRSATCSTLPYQPVLYCNCRRRVAGAAAGHARDSRWLRTIPATCRFSTTTVSYCWASPVVSWCHESARTAATVAWIRATWA